MGWKLLLFIVLFIIAFSNVSKSIIKTEGEKKVTIIDIILDELKHEDLPRLHDHRKTEIPRTEEHINLNTNNYIKKDNIEFKNNVYKELRNEVLISSDVPDEVIHQSTKYTFLPIALVPVILIILVFSLFTCAMIHTFISRITFPRKNRVQFDLERRSDFVVEIPEETKHKEENTFSVFSNGKINFYIPENNPFHPKKNSLFSKK